MPAAGALIVCLLCSAVATAQGPDVDAVARAAIVESVRARLGGVADIRVRDLDVRLSRALPETPENIVATVASGARLGRRVRFSIFESADGTATTRGRRLGYALAVVRAEAPHLRVARAVARGETLGMPDGCTWVRAIPKQSVGRGGSPRIPT